MFFVVCVMCFVVGLARYASVFPTTPLPIGEQTFTGIITSEPDVRASSVNYEVESEKVKSKKILVRAGLYPRFVYGDELSVTCKLKQPDEMYLQKQGAFLYCDRPEITKLNSNKGNWFIGKILALKHAVANKVIQLWHESQASFVAGLLYGYRGGLGELDNLFNRTGVTHIVAISGYNISIIAVVLSTICIQLYIPRKKAFWLVSTGIVLFVIFTGASASVVRAGIMGLIVLFAKQLGRMSQAGRVLVFTAVLMCLQNPLVLAWDAGFQLSFVATLGLVYLSPIIEKHLLWVPVKFGLRESSSSTLSAITATLPLILYQFGRLSIVAPIVNVLILWMIPLVMLGGFVAVVLSFIFFPLGQVIAWVTLLGLNYIIGVVKLFGNWSLAAVDLTIPAWLMFIIYAIMIVYVKNKSSQFSKGL